MEELLARLALSRLVSNHELTIFSPESKHVGTLGFASIFGHMYDLRTRPLNGRILMYFYSLDEGFKSSGYLAETILDPELGHASEANKTAFNKAHNTKDDMWSWLEGPDNRLRLTRFGAAMDGVKNMSAADAILEGSVILRGFPDHHLISRHRTGRVRLGKPPRGLTGCRCRRWRWRAVIDARYPSTASPFYCPRP